MLVSATVTIWLCMSDRCFGMVVVIVLDSVGDDPNNSERRHNNHESNELPSVVTHHLLHMHSSMC